LNYISPGIGSKTKNRKTLQKWAKLLKQSIQNTQQLFYEIKPHYLQTKMLFSSINIKKLRFYLIF